MTTHPDLLMAALKMFLALFAVLGGLLAALHFLRRYLRRPGAVSQDRMVRVLASSYIGFKKHISLVEVPGAVLVLGITQENITFLTRIGKDEVPEEPPAEAPGGGSTAFAEQLRRLGKTISGRDR